MSKSISPMLFLMSEAKPFRASPRSHRSDEFAAGYSLAVCSPAWPASASPAGIHLQTAGSYLSTVSFGKISNWTRRHGQGKISTSGVGQIRRSKWARPEYQTQLGPSGNCKSMSGSGSPPRTGSSLLASVRERETVVGQRQANGLEPGSKPLKVVHL